MTMALKNKSSQKQKTSVHKAILKSTWDRCYDFKNIFAEKFSEKIGAFDSKQS
jgi:hypothetical protein